jgi:hypothetical protein
LLGLPTVIIAYASFASAFAGVTQTSNADLTLRFSSNDPVALTVKADQLLAKTTTQPAKPATLLNLAQRSLHANPVNARAIRLVGIAYGLQNNPATAARLYGLANQISRRDLGNQLLLIEGRVEDGDGVGALKHYDIVLRTSTSGQETLFPILFSAMDDPAIRLETAKLVANNPPWLKAFLAYALTQDAGLANVADVAARSGGLPADATFTPYENAILTRLIATKQFATLERYTRSVNAKGADQLTSIAFRRSSPTDRFQPLAWQVAQENSVSASIETRQENGASWLSAFAAASNRGYAARKLMLTTSGPHEFAVDQTIVETGRDAEIRWEIVCAEGPNVLWTSDGQNAVGRISIRQNINVPDTCKVLWINLIAGGGASERGIEMAAQSITLRPIAKP